MLGHIYIETTPYIKPYSSGRYARKSADGALIDTVRPLYGEDGERPVPFTSKTVEEQHADFKAVELVNTFDHPGNRRRSNEYADKRFAILLDSNHDCVHYPRRRAAWLDEAIYPEGKGNARDYGYGVGDLSLAGSDTTSVQESSRPSSIRPSEEGHRYRALARATGLLLIVLGPLPPRQKLVEELCFFYAKQSRRQSQEA